MTFDEFHNAAQHGNITPEDYGQYLRNFLAAPIDNAEFENLSDNAVFCKVISEIYQYKPSQISLEEIASRMCYDMYDEINDDDIDINKTYDAAVLPVYKDYNLNPVFVRAWIYDRTPISDYDYKA